MIKDLVIYIAKQNYKGLIAWIQYYGLEAGKDKKEDINNVFWIIKQEKEKGRFKEVMKTLYHIHPDSGYFESYNNFDGDVVKVASEEPTGVVQAKTSTNILSKTKEHKRNIIVALSLLILIFLISKL